MPSLEVTIQQRILAHKAEAALKSILEYYIEEKDDHDKMAAKIDEFMYWLWNDSPIA